MQQKFEEFLREVAAYEEHIDHINQTSDALTASGHSESPQIQKEKRQVNSLWMELKELANGRLEVSRFPEFFLQINFLPARRYASAVFATATCPSVCLSVRLSQPVLCENGAF